MSATEVIEFYHPRSIEVLHALSRLKARIRVKIGDESIFVDGTVNPAVYGPSDARADCTLSVDPQAAMDLISGKLSGLRALGTGQLRVSGGADGPNPMDIARHLEAILRKF